MTILNYFILRVVLRILNCSVLTCSLALIFLDTAFPAMALAWLGYAVGFEKNTLVCHAVSIVEVAVVSILAQNRGAVSSMRLQFGLSLNELETKIFSTKELSFT